MASRTTLPVLATMAAGAWTFSTSDFLIRLILDPLYLTSAWILPFTLGLATVAFAALFLALWLPAGWLFVRWGAQRETLAAALVILMLCVGTSYSAWLLKTPEVTGHWVRLAQTLFLIAAASFGAYFVIREIASRPALREWAVSCALATPLLAASAAAADLAKRELDLPVYSLGMAALAASYVALAALAVRWFHHPAGRQKQLRRYVAASALLAVLCMLAWPLGVWASRTEPVRTPARLKVPHVILLTVDTLRRDVLSLYGGTVKTPHIERLARDGVLFRDSYSAAPWTLPAFATIMTGLCPHVHQTVRTEHYLPGSYTTLAEILSEAGYFTKSIGFNFFLSRNGLQQGFQDVSFFPKRNEPFTVGLELFSAMAPKAAGAYVDTTEITDLAVDWVGRHHAREFFLWLHYFDPHGPYSPPPEYHPPGEPYPGIGYHFHDLSIDRFEGAYRRPKEQLEWIRKLYEAEVRYVDDNIGRFLAQLDEQRIYDDALIVFTSDHGEEIGEHYGMDHGHSLYQELIGVPLLVKLPRSARREVVDRPVSNQQVFATVLDLLDIPYQAERIHSRPLFSASGALTAALDSDSAPEETIYATGLRIREDRDAAIFDGMKLIRRHRTPRLELLDLRADPAEHDNLRLQRPEPLERGHQLIDRHLRRAGKLREHHAASGPEHVPVGDRVRNLLRSLGYAQ